MLTEEKFVLPKVEQVAIIVKNVQETADYLCSSLGIGPFRISERSGETTVYGKKTVAKRRLGIAEMGGIDLELIQPLEAGTPYHDFIMMRGEGLQHIRFAPVPDLSRTVTYLEKKGFRLVYGGEHAGSRFAYMESEKAKGFILEFVQRPK